MMAIARYQSLVTWPTGNARKRPVTAVHTSVMTKQMLAQQATTAPAGRDGLPRHHLALLVLREGLLLRLAEPLHVPVKAEVRRAQWCPSDSASCYGVRDPMHGLTRVLR